MLLDMYWNILTMHGSMNGKSPNNTSKWQMRFNSAFKGLNRLNEFGKEYKFQTRLSVILQHGCSLFNFG
jgi:hypothetical protein